MDLPIFISSFKELMRILLPQTLAWLSHKSHLNQPECPGE